MIQAIPHMDAEALLSKARESGLTMADLSMYCQNSGLRPVNVLNALSIEIARRFVTGEISYEIGDETMNGLFTAIIDVSMDEEMPQPAFSIYLGFDAGEYQRAGYSDDIELSERYTHPHLLEILRGLAGTE